MRPRDLEVLSPFVLSGVGVYTSSYKIIFE